MSSSLFVAVPFFSPPLKYSFDGMQEKSVSIPDAFDAVLRRKYHCKSIEQWACAHLIVMAAVRSGDALRSRKYNREDIFWWAHFYKMSSLIEMGEEDRRLVLELVHHRTNGEAFSSDRRRGVRRRNME